MENSYFIKRIWKRDLEHLHHDFYTITKETQKFAVNLRKKKRIGNYILKKIHNNFDDTLNYDFIEEDLLSLRKAVLENTNIP
jgi:hypothetical protein